MVYNRIHAAQYALEYALSPNPGYAYFPHNDCTNFISQCLRMGGAKNDYNPTHPWWYDNGRMSVCWSVAHSLYWYIVTSTTQRHRGIIANTYQIDDNDAYAKTVAGKIGIGDLIQYRNAQGRIQHSTIITAFDRNKEPLVCQHTFNGRNVPWRKPFAQTIFHHIQSVNS